MSILTTPETHGAVTVIAQLIKGHCDVSGNEAAHQAAMRTAVENKSNCITMSFHRSATFGIIKHFTNCTIDDPPLQYARTHSGDLHPQSLLGRHLSSSRMRSRFTGSTPQVANAINLLHIATSQIPCQILFVADVTWQCTSQDTDSRTAQKQQPSDYAFLKCSTYHFPLFYLTHRM